MPKFSLTALVLSGLIATGPAFAEEEIDTENIVNAAYELFGEHKGYRAVHAKGFCGEGVFTATPEAAGVSVASVFDGSDVPVMIRYSLTPGLPMASDSGEVVKSLVARLQPEDGDTFDLLTLSIPFVFMNHPNDFGDFFRALVPDPATGAPDPKKMQAFVAANPEVQSFFEYISKEPVHASYAEAPYYAIHTFWFTNAEGVRRPARWQVKPVAGIREMTDDAKAAAGDTYLQDDMGERTAKAPVEYDLYLQFPNDGDPLNDASQYWPDDRETLKMGRLAVTTVDAAGVVGACDAEMFDPTGLPDGIEPSDDPVLLIRAEAYAVSFSRRLSE